MGRVHGATTQNHFACRFGPLRFAMMDVAHTRCSCVRKMNLRGERPSNYREVLPAHSRPQVSRRSAPARAILLSQLIKSAPSLFSAIEILVPIDAGGCRGGYEHFGERMAENVVGNIERPASTVKSILKPLIVLGFLEVRKHFVVTPA